MRERPIPPGLSQAKILLAASASVAVAAAEPVVAVFWAARVGAADKGTEGADDDETNVDPDASATRIAAVSAGGAAGADGNAAFTSMKTPSAARHKVINAAMATTACFITSSVRNHFHSTPM
jgi:hypothetical protein